MKVTVKEKYVYIVYNSGMYLQARIFEDEDWKTQWKLSPYKSDAKRFNSIQEAREYSGKLGGSRIMRYNQLNGQAEDVEALVKIGPKRRWIERTEI